jgi:hypothetical protein
MKFRIEPLGVLDGADCPRQFRQISPEWIPKSTNLMKQATAPTPNAATNSQAQDDHLVGIVDQIVRMVNRIPAANHRPLALITS